MYFSVELISLVMNSVKVTRHRLQDFTVLSYCLTFFIPYFSTAILSVYTDGKFSYVFTNEYKDEKLYR
jgi:hypothetical protein